MHKTILITGSTDGIGLATARLLIEEGHRVLLHGRNPTKLEQARNSLAEISGADVESYVADLSRFAEVEALAKAVIERHDKLVGRTPLRVGELVADRLQSFQQVIRVEGRKFRDPSHTLPAEQPGVDIGTQQHPGVARKGRQTSNRFWALAFGQWSLM